MTTITLKKKIEFEGKEYLALDVDEPTMGGVEAYEGAKAAGATETAAMIAMLAVETGWPIAVIRKIKYSDMDSIGAALVPFVEPTPAAGSTGEPLPPM